MRWNDRAPFVPLAFVDRLRLRRAALRYAHHGWTVTPGACLAGRRFVCGRAGCPTTGCHPALEKWENSATTDTARVLAWWRHHPHAVLLATGFAFDVIEVPASLGLRVLGAARLHAGVARLHAGVTRLHAGAARPDAGHTPVTGDPRGPIAVTPTGQWMFLVRPSAVRCPALDRCPDVVHHGRGSWIPAAPTRLPEGRVRWAVSPEQCGWRLPAAATVQGMLVDALGALGRPARAALNLPRPVSAAGRAA